MMTSLLDSRLQSRCDVLAACVLAFVASTSADIFFDDMLQNVALNRPTYQSSLYISDYCKPVIDILFNTTVNCITSSALAVDGKKAKPFAEIGAAYPGNLLGKMKTWWVKIAEDGKTIWIVGVMIYTRNASDCTSPTDCDMRDVRVTLNTTDPIKDNTKIVSHAIIHIDVNLEYVNCSFHEGYLPSGARIPLHCRPNTPPTTYLVVQQIPSYLLVLQEVEVYKRSFADEMRRSFIGCYSPLDTAQSMKRTIMLPNVHRCQKTCVSQNRSYAIITFRAGINTVGCVCNKSIQELVKNPISCDVQACPADELATLDIPCGSTGVSVAVYAPCEIGFWDEDCGEECHCALFEPCHPDTGRCPGDLCNKGWTGRACNEVDEQYIWHLGCHIDDMTSPTSSPPRSVLHLLARDEKGMTPAKCIQLCRDHYNDDKMMIAGIKSGTECRCAAYTTTFWMFGPSGGCNAACGRKWRCGATNNTYIISIYSVCPRGYHGYACQKPNLCTNSTQDAIEEKCTTCVSGTSGPDCQVRNCGLDRGGCNPGVQCVNKYKKINLYGCVKCINPTWTWDPKKATCTGSSSRQDPTNPDMAHGKHTGRPANTGCGNTCVGLISGFIFFLFTIGMLIVIYNYAIPEYDPTPMPPTPAAILYIRSRRRHIEKRR